MTDQEIEDHLHLYKEMKERLMKMDYSDRGLFSSYCKIRGHLDKMITKLDRLLSTPY